MKIVYHVDGCHCLRSDERCPWTWREASARVVGGCGSSDLLELHRHPHFPPGSATHPTTNPDTQELARRSCCVDYYASHDYDHRYSSGKFIIFSVEER